jgi:L-ascorbate metabolism protein UlaG (beta-lactamase superfamily)
LSGYASPVSFLGKSFPGTDIYDVDELPAIDLLVLTHDHYDHLDYGTITRLNHKVKKIVAPLGVGTHLEYWGIGLDKITELDWRQSVLLEKEVRLTASPARHFSGRSLQRGKSLWTAYVLHFQGHTLYLGAIPATVITLSALGRSRPV